MTVTRLKPLGNFRASPVRTSTPEPIEIEGGVALLAEAPADPGSPSWPMTVTVNGSPRTRVTTTPAAGQFRVMTQTVIGANGQAVNEYLPLLQFHTSDEGLGGTADYWQSGSVLTSQFFTTLVAFLTPLTGYATIDDLPAATSAQTVRGRPGDIAFLTSGEMAYSTGTEWIIFSGSTPSLMGGMSLGQTIAMAIDAGYVGPSLDGDHSFDAMQGFGADASYVLGVAADETLGAILGLTVDAVIAHVGAHSYGQAFGIDLDASWAGPSVTGALTLGQSIAMSLDATYAAGGGGAIVDPVAGAQVYSENTSQLDVGYPSGVAAGSLLLLVGTNLDPSQLATDGWTEVHDATATYFAAWKRAAGPLAGSYKVNLTGNGEGGWYPVDARMFAFNGGVVASGSPFVASDSNFIAMSGIGGTGTSGIGIAAGDMMILVDIATKPAAAASGSIDSLAAGAVAAPSMFAINLGWKTSPNASGAQSAPVLSTATSSSHHLWTAAVKHG